MTFRQLIAHVTDAVSIHNGHQSPFPDRRQTAAILRGMAEVVAEALTTGESVELCELGTLHIGGPNDEIWFTASPQVREAMRWHDSALNRDRRRALPGPPEPEETGAKR